ncbi:MAG: hypothetical protein QOE34_2202, partial [Verrucomicrobiota bacterium]
LHDIPRRAAGAGPHSCKGKHGKLAFAIHEVATTDPSVLS